MPGDDASNVSAIVPRPLFMESTVGYRVSLSTKRSGIGASFMLSEIAPDLLGVSRLLRGGEHAIVVQVNLREHIRRDRDTGCEIDVEHDAVWLDLNQRLFEVFVEPMRLHPRGRA